MVTAHGNNVHPVESINMSENDQRTQKCCVICGSRRKRNLVTDGKLVKCLRCKTLNLTKEDMSGRKSYRYRNRELFVVIDERKKLRMERV